MRWTRRPLDEVVVPSGAQVSAPGEADVVVRARPGVDVLYGPRGIQAPAGAAPSAAPGDERLRVTDFVPLADGEDEQRAVALADARRDRGARQLGNAAPGAVSARRLSVGRAWVCRRRRSRLTGGRDSSDRARAESAGSPKCQNHSPAAQAGGRGELHERRVGRRRGRRRSARRPRRWRRTPSTTAGERATRTTSAPCPRAVKRERRAGLRGRAVGRGHRRGRRRLRRGGRGEHGAGRERGRAQAQERGASPATVEAGPRSG